MSDGPAPRTVREENSLGPMRKTIAKRLHESYSEAVHVTVSREVEAGPLVAAADDAEEALDVPVSVQDVLLAGVSDALSAFPAFNATFEDGVHRIYEEHNVGVAVDVDAGLVAPVLADVGGRSLGEIAEERRRLTDLARSGEFSTSDLRGGTFTVSNLGTLGIDSFTPVINPPEVAIIGVNRIRDRAVPGEEGVEVRPRTNLDLSFDHRVVDGADAARFLGELADRIEDAEAYVPDGPG